MEKRINIINKIVNLLAKADSTQYEAEAETARKLAAKLMANYEVQKNELEKDDKIIIHRFNSGNDKRKNMKKAMTFNVICKYCGVYLVTCKADYIITGKQNDIEAAFYMFDLIWKQVKDISDNWYESQKKINPLIKVKDKNDYINGLVIGIQYNLDKINDNVFKYKQENGLVAVNQNKSDFNKAESFYTKDQKVKLNNLTIQMNGSYSNGFKDSNKISIRGGVGNNKQYAIA